MLSCSRNSLILSDTDSFHTPERSSKSCFNCTDYLQLKTPLTTTSINLDQLTHPYFTRSVAKRLTSSTSYLDQISTSKSPSISNSCSTDYSQTETRRSAGRNSRLPSLRNFNINNKPVPLTVSRSDNNVLGSYGDCARTGPYPVVVFPRFGKRANLVMDYPPFDPPTAFSRCCRIIQYLMAAVIMVVAVWCIHDHFIETYNFFHKVEANLCKIKEQIDLMEYNVERGAKQQLHMIMEKDTKERLDSIEKILQEIKNSQIGTNSSKPLPGSETLKNTGNKAQNDTIRNLVMEYLHEYNADKTGKIDFALESAGGSIVNFNVEPYTVSSVCTSLFGFQFCGDSNGARAIIQASVLPGECWAFKGASGSAVIKLLGPVFISGVSLEHISKSISPSGEIDSAPKECSIWGLNNKDDDKGVFLGKFEYDINGSPLQYFELDSGSNAYQFIEFKVHSNQGNPLYTCVYRLRVHGALGDIEQPRT